MAYDVQVTTTEPQPYIGITVTTTVQKIGEELGQIYGEIMAHIGGHGIEPIAPPFALYHRMEDDGTVEMTAGVAVDGEIPTTGRIHEGELPGGEVATTTHTGPYENLYDAVMAIDAWMNENGRTARSGHWEHYVDDPGETAPDRLRTVLYWPIA